MNNGLDNISEETESKFSELNKKLEDMITNEQSVIKSFKGKIKKAIMTFLIISLLGYASYEAYRFKRKGDIIFQNSMYYQAVENETLEEITKKICFDNYDLNQIIELNKGFNVWFDPVIDKYEIVHFPKKYVKNAKILKNFEKEKNILDKKILNNKEFVATSFKSNLSEENINKIYQILDEIDYDSKKIEALGYDSYLKYESLSILYNLNNLKSYIKNNIEKKIETLNLEFKQVYNSFKADDWIKPGALEELGNLLSKNNCISSFYIYFKKDSKIDKTKKLEKEIIQKKDEYLALIDSIVNEIKINKGIISQINNDLFDIFNPGIEDEDINLLNSLTEKADKIHSYNLWRKEKIISNEVEIYLVDLESLINNINKKFSFAVEKISHKVNEFKEKNIIKSTFGKDITKEKVRNIYNVLDEIKENKSKYLTLKNELYFKENPDDLLSRIENLETEIKDNIDYENKKAQLGLSKLKNELYNNSWKSTGTIEKLETLDTKRQEIRNFYYCFSDTDKIIELDDIHDYISSKKVSYLKILEDVSKEIEKNKAIVEGLQKQIESILKKGLQNKELPIINQLKNKEKTIKNYNEWIGEKRLQEQIQEYLNKKNSLNYELNRKFNYAVSLLNNELKKFEKEVFDAEKLGRIESGTLRLKHILENNLYTIRHRYYLLGQKNDLVKTENLIKKIKAYIN